MLKTYALELQLRHDNGSVEVLKAYKLHGLRDIERKSESWQINGSMYSEDDLSTNIFTIYI